MTPSSRPLAGFVLIAATAVVQAQSVPTVSAVTRTPIVLTASADGSPPAAISRPPGTALANRLTLSALSGRNNPLASANARKQLVMLPTQHDVHIQTFEFTQCSVVPGASASAFSTPNEVAFTITARELVDCVVDINLATAANFNATSLTQVDVFDDGVLDFDSQVGSLRSTTIALPPRMTSPLVITVRSAASATASPSAQFGSSANTLDILIRSRANTESAQGCVNNLVLESTGRLDGGVDFLSADPLAGRSPIGANALFLGVRQATPVPLPAAANPACSLDVVPVFVAILPRAAIFSGLLLPSGPPAAARPLVLDAQLMSIAGTLAAPSLHSTSTLPLSFR